MCHTCHVDLLFIETCGERRDKLVSKQQVSLCVNEQTNKHLRKTKAKLKKKAFLKIK
jgi:hypothetical protein